MEIRKTSMEIRKINIENRKNWNKFSFKKLGIIFCLFLFGVVTFISGNLAQVSAATSSTVLPVAKGGTGANSASQARTNLNAQETLVSGTNIKSVFGQSLLGSGNFRTLTVDKTSGLAVGESTIIRGTGNPVVFYGIACGFSTGICSWTQPAFNDSDLIYDAGDGVVKSFHKASDSGTPSISLKLFGDDWVYGWARGLIMTSSGSFNCDLYKTRGIGFYFHITKIR
ncbi:MAG: hypothetical protein LBT99_03200 [Bifidobacteriaceae bacterium]|jgi:hypothetical protein|nr:hypothetical protein [Bifidobacteriaceae bacterium]